MSGASQRASDQCGVTGEVVILASTRRVAAGASDVGHAEGELGTRLTLTPLVLLLAGKSIDAMLSEDHPELAFFAVWAVRGRRGPRAKRVLREALRRIDTLPEALQPGAARAIFAVLREPLAAYFSASSLRAALWCPSRNA